MKKLFNHVMVTGGAGYVGATLVPKLLEEGYKVTVLDLYLYMDSVLPKGKQDKNLREIKGDIRDPAKVTEALKGVDAVIHLACISNDPSFELNPNLGKSINFDAFEPLVKASKEAGIKRFIYASSSSVYGVKEVENVTEDLALEPLTDYSKFKAMCEEVLLRHSLKDFTTLIVRPATVCGYSPRLRLDLTVNILTNHAVTNGTIKVFGGGQKRPNIHILDMVDFYLSALTWPANLIDKKIYNAGYENRTVSEIAAMVKNLVKKPTEIVQVPTDDNRSYHVSSKKLELETGFKAKRTIEDAINSLVEAFDSGLIKNSMTDSRYYNIKKMQEVSLN